MKTRKPPFSFTPLDPPPGLGLRQPSGAFRDAMRDAKAAEGCRSPRRYRVSAVFGMIITAIQAALPAAEKKPPAAAPAGRAAGGVRPVFQHLVAGGQTD